MGAWGSGLYSNDTTCDIRDTYMDYLKDQLSNQEAYDKIMKVYSDDSYAGDEDSEPLFWYALAETQWKVGRLMPEVKSKALEWIDNNGGLALWEESKSDVRGWKKTLEKLKVKLESEQPKERKLRKPIILNQNLWNMGDAYAYQFHTEESAKNGAFGKYMVIQKIGEEPYSSDEDIIMRVHVFDRLFDEVPTIEDVKGVRLLPLGYPHSKSSFSNINMNTDIEQIKQTASYQTYMELKNHGYSIDYPTSSRCLNMNITLGLMKKKDYPDDYLTYIGNTDIPANVVRRQRFSSDGSWFNMEGWSRYFPLWQGIEYETIEEGVFMYTRPEAIEP